MMGFFPAGIDSTDHALSISEKIHEPFFVKTSLIWHVD